MKNKRYDEKARLREILSILRKNKIFSGGLTPEKVRKTLEDLGPTYIKIGQIMSMQADTIPHEFLKELEKLRTNVPPMSDEDLKFIIQESYHKDINELFDDFSEQSFGSASIAQVHSAKLKGTDTKVVLKIQRKDIYERMEQDIALMRKAAKMLRFVRKESIVDFDNIIDELWKTAQEEMNFLIEADNAIKFYNNHTDTPYATGPKIYQELTNEKILVMEYIDGFFINDLEKIEELGYDRKEIACKLAEDYITQIIDNGFFHADPHPGNIKIRDGQIVWIDLGMMGKLNARDKSLISGLVSAIAKHDTGKIEDIALTLGTAAKDINHSKLYADIDYFLNKYGTMELGNMSLAGIVSELLDILNNHKINVPANISMLGRGLMTIEGLLAFLYPEINILEITAQHINNHTDKKEEFKRKLKQTLIQLEGGMEKFSLIPGFTADILRMIAKGQLKMNSELQISESAQFFINRMLNRIIIGMIIVALIIGSSLIAMVKIQPVVAGLPVFTTSGYIVAAVLSFFLYKNRNKKK